MIDKDIVASGGSAERELLDSIDLARLPRHVAIIMDGNGRWAKRAEPAARRGASAGDRGGARHGGDVRRGSSSTRSDALRLLGRELEASARSRSWTLMTLLKEYVAQGARQPGRERHPASTSSAAGDELDASVVSDELERGLEATAGVPRHDASTSRSTTSGRTEIVDACRASSPTRRPAGAPTSTRRPSAATSTPPASPTPTS